jgi:hypothetical protein
MPFYETAGQMNQQILNACLLCFVLADVVVWRLHVRRTHATIDRFRELLLRSREIGRLNRIRKRASATNASLQVKECRDKATRLLGTLAKIRQLAAEETGHDDDWSQPIMVGDPEKDPLAIEIAYCGPNHISVYSTHWPSAISTEHIEFHDRANRVLVGNGREVVLVTHKGIGHAELVNATDIVTAVQRYNESYHASKGVEDARSVEEEEPANSDRRGYPDHGRQSPERRRASRGDRPRKRACPPRRAARHEEPTEEGEPLKAPRTI